VSTFVGRTEELRVLEELFARSGDGVLAAIVMGDPGTGKTRLLAEAVDRFAPHETARIVGYEPEQSVPLAACADLLHAFSAAPAGRGLRLLLEQGTPALAPMRIFEAAHRALDAVGPLLLVVDDLQWVDQLSLALCHYLVRAGQAAAQPLVLLAAARPSAEATTLAASLSHVLPPDRVANLALEPLSAEESLQLVNALAPGTDAATARRVAEQAQGSPFWLEALARPGGSAADAAQLVTARLRGASADAATLVGLLAVTARPLSLADAALLHDWSVARMEHAASELVSRGIAVTNIVGVRLAHDVVRDAAYREIPEETRRALHGRLAEWLERIAGEDLGRLREALAHRHAAAMPSHELALRLARAPRRTLLGDEGLTLLVSIADDADPDDERTLSLNIELAALAVELANHAVALERWSRVAERAAEPLQRASALLAASRSAFALDDADAARSYLKRAGAVGVTDAVFDLEREAHEASIELWMTREGAPARTHAYTVAQRAHAIVETAGGVEALDDRARRAYLEALRIQYETAYQEDDPETLLRTSGERAALARGFDDEAYLAALIDNARVLRRIGRLPDAEQGSRAAWQEAHRRVLPQLTIDSGYWLGSVLEQQGRILDAEEIVTEAIDLAERVGDQARARHRISRLGHKISLHRGDWRRALDAFLAEAGTVGTHGRIEFHQDAAVWLASVGGRELEPEVLTQVAEAGHCADLAACPRCGTELRLAVAEALVRIGHHEEAASSLAVWKRRQGRPQPRDEVLRLRIEALLAGGNGNGAAVSLLGRAVDEADRLGLVLDALWTRIDVGRALAGADRDQAIDILREVAETAAALGALTEQHVAEKDLRGLGVRTWRRTAVSETLTEREREIADLIAAGASNPEIAQALFLSRKTVERHVSNLLKKVGARNRAELAAKVAERKVEGAPR
jgi:DNA-binding CsgD family transcriptional regulator